MPLLKPPFDVNITKFLQSVKEITKKFAHTPACGGFLLALRLFQNLTAQLAKISPQVNVRPKKSFRRGWIRPVTEKIL